MKTLLSWIGRLLLGGTFAYAAILKLADPAAFAADIGHYRLLPYPLTLALGLYLPWLELISAAAVILRWRERGALVVLLGLCVIFSLAIASAWWRGLDITCGCFGSAAANANLPVALARTVTLGLIAFGLARGSRHFKP
ncbi:MAG TPA: MauE/DoxX family redox-associated membrane protein [Lacunisphaera sp.]|nr:MauE/DoxX family redox-associated membrane protein [Lacunisphaera sp.]